MTPQKAQIQALINDIDRVLGKASPRLPWVMSGEATQQRQVLEQTRNYLIALQQQVSAPEFEPSSTGGDLAAYGASASLGVQPQSGAGATVESAQQVLQAVLEEMSYLRANVMQPLRSDIEEMSQRRDSLVQEIKQLEADRQQYALPQSDEFFQTLRARLREDLAGQMTQMVASLESENSERALRAASDESDEVSSSQSLLTPTQRLQQLQAIQSQSDQLVLKLDTTLRVVFDSLQDSVKSYQESLGQGLDRMHSLGQQGEAMFAALMSRLAGELGRGASSYLQSSIETTDWEPRPTLQGVDPSLSSGTTPAETVEDIPSQPSQATGANQLPSADQLSTEQVASEQVTDAEIDKLLNELNEIAPSTPPDQSDQTAVEDSISASAASVAPVTDAELEDLDLLTFELDDLPLEIPPDADDVTAFQVGEDFQLTEAGMAAFPESSLAEDNALFQDNQFDFSFEEPPADDNEPNPTAASEPQIADLDSALDLLNQLSVELHEESVEDEPEATPTILESAIVPEPPDEEFELPSDSVAMSAAVASPDNLYNQLDDFYQNMFGAGENAAAEQPETRLTDLSPNELAADLGVEPIATPTSPEPVQEANIPGDLVNERSEQAIAPLDDAFLSSELSDELFGGLSDPSASVDDTRLSLPPEVLVDETSADQPLEDFPLDLGLEDFPLTDLLSEPDSISADVPEMSLTDEEILPVVEDESEDVTAELLPPPQSQPAPPDEIDTIANLSDLLDSAPAAVEPEIQPEPIQPGAIAPIEDAYVTAAPDEDLLAAEESQTDPRVDLQLDPDVLEQLTADLSNLEGLQGSNLSALEADLETSESPDWTFVDWDETEPAAEQPSSLSPEPLLEESLLEEPLLEDTDFLEPEIEAVEPVVEPVSEDPTEEPIEAIPAPDTTSSISSETPDTIDDLFFPDTSDLSDLLSYQEALAAEVADQEISAFEDEELGSFGDQELGSFSSESATELPLLDESTTLADLFSPASDLSAESDLELEDELLTDDFEDLTAPASQRETTLEELFAIAEVDTAAPSPPPSETETSDVFDLSFEQSPPESSQPDYDLALEDLFALPPDDLDAAPLPEGEYASTEQDELQLTESPSSSWTSETTLEGLFDLSDSEVAPSPAENPELTLDDFVQEVAAPDDVPVSPGPSDSLDESSSATLDFADFENLEPEQPNIQEDPDTFTLEGLDSLFEEVAEAESQPSISPSNLFDPSSDFEPSPGLEASSEGWTLENAFAEPEPPVEYGSATDLGFLEAVPPVEYGSTTDLYTADLEPLDLPDVEYGSATDLPPVEVDSNPEAISSPDLDFFEIEPTDAEDAEKKTLNSDLTATSEPDLEFADVNFADAEFAELTSDLITEPEPEPEPELGVLPDDLSDPSVVEEAVELELPELELELTSEAVELPELENSLTDSTTASLDGISVELPVELPVEAPIDIPEAPAENSEEDGVDDWSDRLPADFDPSDLPVARLDDANPFPDIALLDPGFGLQGLEAGLQGEIPPSGESAEEPVAKDWYLGIDFGTTGISAVLLNRSTCELYPIYWSEARPQDQGGFIADKSFRLPAIAYLSTGRDTPVDPNLPSPNQDQAAVTSVAIGSLALDLNQRSHSGSANFDAESFRLLLRDFKPYLSIGVPHYSPQTSGWEPVLQWSDQHPLEMSWLHQALQTLLATLSHHRLSTPAHSALSCAAVGLDAATFQAALRQLAGVVMSYPANWSDTYSFNIREAVLGARLVAHPEQIFFIEDAIATLLSGLRSSDGRAVVLPNNLSQKPYLYNTDWQGSTLVISAGASVTEMALVDLPSALQNLTYQDFTLRSLPYAGKALDQDIICQLLYPTWSRQLRRSDTASDNYSSSSGQAANSSAFVDGWHWQPTESNSEMTWASLELESLTLPSAGEPDPVNRQRLQQRLESSPMGQSLLEAARYLKLILQQQDRFNLELGDQQWTVMRRELGSRVLLPYIQRLNRELNALLTQSGVPIQSINQVICTGGTASFGAIARWLRQKLPNATIIQDTYTNSRTGSTQESRLPTCSRVAYGLATLPLHPQVLNLPRQQYSDYFLLMELLRAFPDQPLSLSQIMQMLERRGINTQACRLHILALLEGHLPPGLVPTQKHADLLAQQSKQNPDYQMLLAAPLFQKLDSQTYRPNYQQWNHFRSYLSTITASTHQKLSEPLTVGLSVSAPE